MPHHHAAGIAGGPLRRFRGNACAFLQHRLAGRIGIGQHSRVDVDHDLVALARRAGRDYIRPTLSSASLNTASVRSTSFSSWTIET
jgi:hypothetical protein